MLRFLLLCFLLIASAATASAQPATPTPSPPDPCAEVTVRATRAETKLKDWPALARYHEANIKIAAPAKNEDRVVFLGDSITDSWQNPKFGGFFPGQPYVDRGISGQTTPQMLIRFRPDVIAL